MEKTKQYAVKKMLKGFRDFTHTQNFYGDDVEDITGIFNSIEEAMLLLSSFSSRQKLHNKNDVLLL